MKRSSIFLAIFAAAGCDAPFAMSRVAAARAPSDLACPAASVSRDPHGSHLATEPVFRGCGRTVVYHCMKTSGIDDTSCAPIRLR